MIPVPTRPNISTPKRIQVKFDKWPKGLNVLFAASKIRDDELSEASNVLLVDEGSPTRRPGTGNYSNSSGGTKTTNVYAYYPSTADSQLLKLEDGLLKKLNLSTLNWSAVTGASFTTNTITAHTQTADVLYLSNGVDALTKYDGSGLITFTAINAPTGINATRGASLASGTYQYSYTVTAETAVGETTVGTAATVQVNKLREDWTPDATAPIDNVSVVVGWTPVANATGYNIYAGSSGDELFMQHVEGQAANTWRDYGTRVPSDFGLQPASNTTGGPKGSVITEFKSSLLIAGDPNNPSRVYYSAGVDKPDSFGIGTGGGFIDISKNSDDGEITGLAKYQGKAVVFKERSVWQFDFTQSTLVQVDNIAKDIGCISHRTIKPVENDIFFLGRKPGGGPAIYVLGNEPNYLNVLRTNELSARVRPVLQGLTFSNFRKAHAVYQDSKYHLFFTDGSGTVNNAAVVYDRERVGFTEFTDFYADDGVIFYDPDGDDKFILVNNNDGRITEYSDEYTTDKGTAIEWSYATKQTDLGDPMLYKKFRYVNFRLKDVGGEILTEVITEDNTFSWRSILGSTSLSTAFGSLKFGSGKFGETLSGGTAASDSELIRYIPILERGHAANARTIKFRQSGSTGTSRATLLDLHIEAQPKSKSYHSRSEILRVNT